MDTYEKKYKEAQKWIESIYSELSYEQQMEAEAFFPELRESEDEKIRKHIISVLEDAWQTCKNIDYDSSRIQEDIAWLEKQGDKDKLIKELGEYKVKYTQEVLSQQLEKQGERKPTDKIEIGKKYQCIASPRYSTFRRGEIYKPVDNFLCNLMNLCSDCFEPIEDSEHNPILDFKAKDWYVSKVDGKIHNIYYSADKVEPKFHEGDWVVFIATESVYQVEKMENYVYTLRNISGGSFCLSFSLEELIREWTIQDAKDGDVLVAPPVKGSEHSEQIFIFKEIKDREYVKNAVEYYCRCMDNEFAANECGFMGQSDDYFEPATKEQRDTLIKAMTDAGWEFDFEKKELKKISQRMVSAETKEALYDKPAWSEEDEDMVRYIGNAITCKESTKYLEEKGIDMIKAHRWLESFKPQLKKEWSEEDEKMVGNIRSIIEKYAFSQSAVDVNGDLCEKKFIDVDIWLKSFKDRVQPKQEWNEDDEEYFNFLEKLLENLQVESTEDEIKYGTNSHSEYYYKIIQWLKSIKDMIQYQSNQEWSEEDEKTYVSILNDLRQNVIPDEEDINWFKSIKQRIGGKV